MHQRSSLTPGVEAEHAAELDVSPVELLAQRDDDVPRLEGAGGRARQERRVQEEVGVAEDGDARAVARQHALEAPRRVEAAEAHRRR